MGHAGTPFTPGDQFVAGMGAGAAASLLACPTGGQLTGPGVVNYVRHLPKSVEDLPSSLFESECRRREQQYEALAKSTGDETPYRLHEELWCPKKAEHHARALRTSSSCWWAFVVLGGAGAEGDSGFVLLTSRYRWPPRLRRCCKERNDDS